MECVWITNASPTIQAVVDPVVAACDTGFVPTQVYLIENPGIDAEGDKAMEIVEDVIDAYGESATVESEMLSHELDFDAIADFYQRMINQTPAESEIAIDLTPGRKFMSVLAFQAGRRFGADHIYYLYIHSSQYYDRPYPEMPDTAVELIDFVEVIQ